MANVHGGNLHHPDTGNLHHPDTEPQRPSRAGALGLGPCLKVLCGPKSINNKKGGRFVHD
jgi:hypothetical protein